MKASRPLALFAFALPVLAWAHPGHDGHDLSWDFNTGLAHPFSGWDHLAAMVTVGLWAAQLGGRARWLVPSSFVIVMGLGAALARTGVSVPGVEQAVAASILVLGLLVATAARLPLGAGMGLVGVFAAFHGLAHGMEMPPGSADAGYAFGFILATASLHAAGLGLGTIVAARSERALQAAGWVVAVWGAALFVL